LPAPGTTSASAERLALPVFLPPPAPKDATLWAILSWGSALLHGISRRLRHRPFDRRHLSWGSRPFNARGGESSRPTGCPADPPVLPGSYQRVPPRRLRCRSQVFSTSQRLLPLPTVPPFSGGWRSWGSPYRGLFLPRSPDDSSPPACPLDVAPSSCASPFLGGVLVGAAEVT